MKGFKQHAKDAKQVLDVMGTTKKSPYCMQHMAAITAYVKASQEMKDALDKLAVTESQELPPQ